MTMPCLVSNVVMVTLWKYLASPLRVHGLYCQDHEKQRSDRSFSCTLRCDAILLCRNVPLVIVLWWTTRYFRAAAHDPEFLCTSQAAENDYKRRTVLPPCVHAIAVNHATAAQNPQEGFLQGDGSLTIRLRVRLLFLVLHVYTTADLAAHRGFGVVNVQADQKPQQYSHHCVGTAAADGDPSGASAASTPLADEERIDEGRGIDDEDAGRRGGGRSSEKKGSATHRNGSLPCFTLEVLQCTSLEELEKMIARVLGDGVESSDIRLWVITQPVTDAPLAPRELLRCVHG